MTESSAQSARAEAHGQVPRQKVNWLGVPLIGAAAVIAIILNLALMMLVQGHTRSMDARDNELRRREIAVEALESRRESTVAEINKLESSRLDARRRVEEAEKAASDAQGLKLNRDALAREIENATAELARQRGETETLRGRVAGLKTDETAAQLAISARRDETTNLERQRGALQREISDYERQKATARRDAEEATKAAADVSILRQERDKVAGDAAKIGIEVTRQKGELDGLRGQVAGLRAQEADARQAIGLRRDEQTALDRQIAPLRTELAELENRRQAALGRATEAEKSAGDSVKLRTARDTAQRDLDSARNEIDQRRIEAATLKSSVDTLRAEEAAAKQAAATRLDAERLLAARVAELNSANQQVAAAQAEVERLRSARVALTVDEARVKQIGTERAEVEQQLISRTTELGSLRQQIAVAQVELERLRLAGRSIVIDESATKMAVDARAQAEQQLAELEGRLQLTRKTIREAQRELDALNSGDPRPSTSPRQ